MARDHVILRAEGEATEDLSAKQYYLVQLSETGTIKLAEAGNKAFVLIDTPKKNQIGTYSIVGISKAVAGEEIKAGEYVSAGAEGKVVKATEQVVKAEKVEKTGSYIIGQALTKVAKSGSLVQLVSGMARA